MYNDDTIVAIATASGIGSICGAAAVMATQSVLKNEAYKSAIAVSFVVIFGTIGMFLILFLNKFDIFGFTNSEVGIYIGNI